MIWQLQETGQHRLNFWHQFCRFCECTVPGYRFWGGPIALQCFVRICDKKNSCNTKVVFNHFDRDSCIYIYMIIYAYTHMVAYFLRGKHRRNYIFDHVRTISCFWSLLGKIHGWITCLASNKYRIEATRTTFPEKKIDLSEFFSTMMIHDGFFYP